MSAFANTEINSNFPAVYNGFKLSFYNGEYKLYQKFCYFNPRAAIQFHHKLSK